MLLFQMRTEDYLENSYWNKSGKYQKEYDEMRASNFEFNKTTLNAFHSYYRFHNHGDVPASYKYHAEEYQKVVEAKVDERIAREYKRFTK